MNFKGIKETCLYIKDLEKARAFYADMLGLEIISYLPDKHLFFKVGYSVLLCFNPDDSGKKTSPPGHYAHGPQHFAFEVDATEYEAHKKQIQQKGIQIIDLVIWESGQESFYFKDPAGNILEIVQVGIWD